MNTWTKPAILILVGIFLILQYELWFSAGGFVSMWHLKHEIVQQKQVNQQLALRNSVIQADIADLKNGNQAIEERARNELGMIKKGEVYYRVVGGKKMQATDGVTKNGK